jgi:hypothetical protein
MANDYMFSSDDRQIRGYIILETAIRRGRWSVPISS